MGFRTGCRVDANPQITCQKNIFFDKNNLNKQFRFRINKAWKKDYLDNDKLKKMKDLNGNTCPASDGSTTFVVYTTKFGGFPTLNSGIYTLATT